MKITLRYFASVREAMGTASEPWESSAPTLGALRAELVARGGAGAQVLGADRSVRMALNHVMSDADTPLVEGCEAAFFPPVTGG